MCTWIALFSFARLDYNAPFEVSRGAASLPQPSMLHSSASPTSSSVTTPSASSSLKE